MTIRCGERGCENEKKNPIYPFADTHSSVQSVLFWTMAAVVPFAAKAQRPESSAADRNSSVDSAKARKKKKKKKRFSLILGSLQTRWSLRFHHKIPYPSRVADSFACFSEARSARVVVARPLVEGRADWPAHIDGIRVLSFERQWAVGVRAIAVVRNHLDRATATAAHAVCV
jgi:hypothetical protein